jgi:hypothetical protein
MSLLVTMAPELLDVSGEKNRLMLTSEDLTEPIAHEEGWPPASLPLHRQAFELIFQFHKLTIHMLPSRRILQG